MSGRPPRRDLNLTQRYSRWALWGCVTLVLVMLLLGGGFLIVWMQRPSFGRWMRYQENLTICQEHVAAVAGALGRYHADKGRMPARLQDLYPTYLSDPDSLYCPSDPAAPKGLAHSPTAPRAQTPRDGAAVKIPQPAVARTPPERTSYAYRTDLPWGTGRGVIVYCPHHPVPIIETPKGSDRIYRIPVIRQDGTVDALTAPLSEVRPGNASPAPTKAPKQVPAPAAAR
jgi:hypothetical protein